MNPVGVYLCAVILDWRLREVTGDPWHVTIATSSMRDYMQVDYMASVRAHVSGTVAYLWLGQCCFPPQKIPLIRPVGIRKGDFVALQVTDAFDLHNGVTERMALAP